MRVKGRSRELLNKVKEDEKLIWRAGEGKDEYRSDSVSGYPMSL